MLRYTDNASPHDCRPTILVVGDGQSKILKVDLSLPPFECNFGKNPVTGITNATFAPVEGKVTLDGHILTIEFNEVLKEGQKCSVGFFLLFDSLGEEWLRG